MLMFMFLCGCVDADVLDMGGGGNVGVTTKLLLVKYFMLKCWCSGPIG